MNDPKEYYKILELTDADKNLPFDEFSQKLKSSFRKKAIKYHPDKNPGDKSAEEKFKKLAEAYEVLSDKNKKENYDNFGTAETHGFQNGFPGFDDIFSQFFHDSPFGGLGGFNPFGGFGQNQTQQHQEFRKPGENILKQITISLADAYNGTQKDIEIMEYTICHECNGKGGEFNTCPHCNGTGVHVQQAGFMRVQSTCPQCGGRGQIISKKCNHCHGSGFNEKTKKININVPACISNDMTLRLANLGKPGINAQNGDLLVKINISENKQFIRKDNDLYTVIKVRYSDILNNKPMSLNVFGNTINFNLPLNHDINDDIIIPNKGFKDIHSNNRGDLHIGLQIPILKEKISTELYNKLVEIENQIFN